MARKVLERNNPRNNPSQEAQSSAQQRGIAMAVDVAPEVAAAREAFIDLVRITAACEHGRLLHRASIRRELDERDAADLLNTTRAERQAWAAAIAQRLTRPGPGWEPTP